MTNETNSWINRPIMILFITNISGMCQILHIFINFSENWIDNFIAKTLQLKNSRTKMKKNKTSASSVLELRALFKFQSFKKDWNCCLVVLLLSRPFSSIVFSLFQLIKNSNKSIQILSFHPF